MKDNLLVTLADRNYINQAKQLFSSAYWNAGWKGDYMLLAHEIPEKELKWFRDKGILVKKCRPIYEWNIGVKESRPSTVMSKFYLFTPFFKKWKNIIFIESDTIVRASLNRLSRIRGFYATDISDKSRLLDQISDTDFFKELKEKYDLNKPSFNPGVMVFSSDIIIDKTFAELKSLSKKYRKISNYGEEGIINLYFYKKWKKLPLIYNLWPYRLNLDCGIKQENVGGIVLHFVKIENKNELRPWNSLNSFYQEWKSNLERAELIDLNNIPEGKKWGSFKIMRLSLYLRAEYYLRGLLLKIKKVIENIKDSFYRKIYLRFKSFLIYILYPKLKNSPDRLLGIMGQFIKRYNPYLYHKLKKIKNEQ